GWCGKTASTISSGTGSLASRIRSVWGLPRTASAKGGCDMPRGVVERIVPEEGFGFLRSGQQEFFFHRTGLNGTEFEELAVGTPVEFSVSPDHRGDEPGEHTRAVNVRLSEDGMPADDNEPLPPEKLRP